jgi:hypothetical protein
VTREYKRRRRRSLPCPWSSSLAPHQCLDGFAASSREWRASPAPSDGEQWGRATPPLLPLRRLEVVGMGLPCSPPTVPGPPHHLRPRYVVPSRRRALAALPSPLPWRSLWKKTRKAYGTILARWVWARHDYRRVGMHRVDEKNNSFLAEMLSKM